MGIWVENMGADRTVHDRSAARESPRPSPRWGGYRTTLHKGRHQLLALGPQAPCEPVVHPPSRGLGDVHVRPELPPPLPELSQRAVHVRGCPLRRARAEFSPHFSRSAYGYILSSLLRFGRIDLSSDKVA
eukprot:1179154-Prorocentrum_minimum.AAC.2